MQFDCGDITWIQRYSRVRRATVVEKENGRCKVSSDTITVVVKGLVKYKW